jgi:ABC-type branched-subunit amino acid transport system substrate-binding protein
MALRDLELEGVKTTLNVFDLQSGTPSSYDLGKNDFVLGPITANDLGTILGITGGQVPVVSPLDQRAADLAETHDNFIQAPSSPASQYAELAAWAAEEYERGDQVILVTEKTSNGSTAPAVGVREALLAAGTAFEGVSWTQAEGRSLPASLTARLTKGGVNRIIVASEKEAFVSDIVRNISILLGRGYKIVMYAPSRVRTFDTIDSSLYHQCSLHICSPYFADYDAENVKAFIRSYRALYRTEPSQFAFQGYDLTRYFADLVAKYGDRWPFALREVTGSGIHTDFHFEPVRSGSYRNTAIRRIVYGSDYSTELVR